MFEIEALRRAASRDRSTRSLARARARALARARLRAEIRPRATVRARADFELAPEPRRDADRPPDRLLPLLVPVFGLTGLFCPSATETVSFAGDPAELAGEAPPDSTDAEIARAPKTKLPALFISSSLF